MRQDETLTQLQAAYLPALMWLFDRNRYRAQGRSTLVAHAAIRLAMQGERVFLYDLSEALTGPTDRRLNQRFVNLVLHICGTRYEGHRFEFRQHDNSLEYRGQHPR